ncbi:hypothetical protein Ahy_B03g067209 [Arachis hypogaea]|uniref:Uncharacterized protein n=1 Tax=Arachis hypogaea TaxID=3818 RepID=A0A445A637_ARAHY|nr:hypothetical protein Ahy_B03g067209 [Arachis hypogaea]
METMMATERVCYVHCNFCNTILAEKFIVEVEEEEDEEESVRKKVMRTHNNAVSVPYSSLLTLVTVRCGHCANLLTVNMGASLQPLIPPHQEHHHQKQHLSFEESSSCKELGSSSSKCNKIAPFEPVESHQSHRIPPIRPPEKRQRVPSAYNRFIKDISWISFRVWAHFPHIHFGLKMDGNNDKQAKLDHNNGEGTQKSSNGFY